MHTAKKENSWRRHQADFLQQKKKKALALTVFSILFKGLLPVVLAGTLVIGSWIFFDMGNRITSLRNRIISLTIQLTESTGEKNPPKAAEPTPVRLTKPELVRLVRGIDFLNAQKKIFFVDTPQDTYMVISSLNTDLMAYLTATLEHLKTLTRGKPRQIAMVVMDANTGGLLGLAGYDLEDPKSNPCTRADFPAASVFKLVTATAAVDALGYTPHTPVYFNGNKYTLYKRQLKETRNRYTVKISLAKAFAESINPVFGKLARHHLGLDRLTAYANGFGFNQEPESELVFEPGVFTTTEDSYHLAELGCGFNHDTRISPVFGAMIVSSVLNSGRSLVPAIVEKVSNSGHQALYRHKKAFHKTAMTPGTADAMIRIMGKTISGGTAKKSFRGYTRDNVLSTLILGGKTGSLFNRERTIKYDWFTGFAKEKKGGKAITVSIVVGHGKYIGTRSATHAKNIFKHYFQARILPKSG